MWPDPPRLSRAVPLNLVYDGNSILYGIGASPGRSVPAQVQRLLEARFADIVSINRAISGQTWAAMDGRSTSPGDGTEDVDGAYVAGRTNVLVLWETTNSVALGQSAAAAAEDARRYVANRLAANGGWRIVVVGALPRQAGPGWSGDQATIDRFNRAIVASDAILRDNLRGWGGRRFVDIRCPGSPFRYADYGPARFAADDALWLEAAGERVHLADAGYAIAAGLIARAILNLPAH